MQLMTDPIDPLLACRHAFTNGERMYESILPELPVVTAAADQ
jgi:hypothetical protein